MVTCEICGRALKNKSGLSGHLRLVHHGEMSVPRPGAVPHRVNMEYLGPRAARRADDVRAAAAVVSDSSAKSAVRLDGVSLEYLNDAAIALGLEGLEAKVERIRVDGVPLEYLTKAALAIGIKGLRVIMRERGIDVNEVLENWE